MPHFRFKSKSGKNLNFGPAASGRNSPRKRIAAFNYFAKSLAVQLGISYSGVSRLLRERRRITVAWQLGWQRYQGQVLFTGLSCKLTRRVGCSSACRRSGLPHSQFLVLLDKPRLSSKLLYKSHAACWN